jgi:hypothetical protein
MVAFMATPDLVTAFYERIRNVGDPGAVRLLGAVKWGAPEFSNVSSGWRSSIHDSAQRKPEQSSVT